MAIVMLPEAKDCDEPEWVLQNGRNLSPIASRGRSAGHPYTTLDFRVLSG